MPIESWTAPEETPALAAHAAAMIDAALVGSGLTRDAYWEAVRKGYNTPYNDPPPKNALPKNAPPKRSAPAQVDAIAPPPAVVTVTAQPEAAPLPVAAMAALTAEARAV